MNTIELPEQWRTHAMVITAVDDPISWFSPSELEVVNAFRHEKRRREWMLSRIAEKELRRSGASGTCVSFSHSGAFGAAAIAEEPIGIDVEVMRSIPHGALHLFLTEEEASAANACACENALLHFWSAKEAKWKQLGGTVPTLKRVPLRLIGVTGRGIRFDGVETFASGDVVVALSAPLPK